MSVTQKDISVHLGIPRITVARALTGGVVSARTRQLVLDAASELGYTSSSNREARQLIARRYGNQILTNVVAVMLPPLDASVRRSAFFGPLLEGIESEAESRKLDTVICVARDRGIPDIIRKGVDGVVTLASTYSLDAQLKELGRPVVTASFAGRFHAVISEDKQGIGLVMRHLLKLGHRKIGYFGYPPDTVVSAGRLATYEEEMAARGIEVDSRFISLGIWAHETADSAVSELLQKSTPTGAILPEFTALVCYNDRFALLMIAALERRGIRVPQDISVTGYDATTFVSGENPTVTSIDFDRVAMGRLAVNIVYQARAKDASVAQATIVERVPVSLRIADTTAPVRK